MSDGHCTNRLGSIGRRRLFRFAAVLLGLSVFVLAELVLALAKFDFIDERDDPFVGFDDIRPLFVLDEADARLEIPRSRQQFFAPESFPVLKGKQTFRIFCLGGSTVQGRPYSTATSFTTWLRLSLESADPSRRWEAINCGGISYASYRLVPILRECLEYEPDLLVVCTGHNEFLEERTYGRMKQVPAPLRLLRRKAAGLRTFALLHRAYRSLARDDDAAETSQLPTETDALLEYRRGIDAYHRDAEFRAGVVEHYAYNVRRMIALSKRAGVPLILIRPPSNLRDCPPFKSEHRLGLSAGDLKRWTRLIERAKSHYRGNLDRSIALFRQAHEIDGQYAATHYELGRCYLLTGQPDRARDAFWQARELDICPLRMIAPLEETLAAAALEADTQLIDAFSLLESECRDGLSGDEILVDHIHPNFRGHRSIANSLAEAMIERGWVAPEAGWDERRDRAYQRHFDSLESIYFALGLRDLKALRAWAAGRVDGPELKMKQK